MVNRNAGAGTRVLIDRLLERCEAAGLSPTSRNRTTRSPPRSRKGAPIGGSRSSRSRGSTGSASCRWRRKHYDFIVVESAPRAARQCKAFLAVLHDERTREPHPRDWACTGLITMMTNCAAIATLPLNP